LDLQDGVIDLLICEVKSSVPALAFNEPIKTATDALAYVLSWSGVFKPNDIPALAENVRTVLQDGVPPKTAMAGILHKSVRIRGLLSCPPCTAEQLAGRWALSGSEIMRFADECFNPPEPRPECSTRYSLNMWGSSLAPIVEYIKKGNPTVAGLYNQLNAG
jgi:hypothetical protein